MKLLAGFLIAASAFAVPQSLVLSSAVGRGSLTLPAVAPFNTGAEQNLNFRLEFRMHSFTVPPDSGHRTSLFKPTPGIDISMRETGEIVADMTSDSASANGGTAAVDLTGHTDVIVRVTRNATNREFGVQAWDSITQAYIGGRCGYIGLPTNSISCHLDAPLATTNISGTRNAFDFTTGVSPTQTASIAWLKIYSTIAPRGIAVSQSPNALQSQVPIGELDPADIADFRFNGSLANVGTGGYAVTFSYPGATYSSTPVSAPFCDAGATQIVRAGATLTLDPSASFGNNGAALASYQWALLSGPSQIRWTTARNIAAAAFTNLVFGDYKAQLTVTDTDGRSSSCTVDHGVSGTDANGVVVSDNPIFDLLLYPTLRRNSGNDPWGNWFDDYTEATAKEYIGLQNSKWAPTWRTPLAGTVSVPAQLNLYDSSTGLDWVGVGTHFMDEFCNGGHTSDHDADPSVMLWYPNHLTGQTTYRRFHPTTCTDQTHMHTDGNTFFLINHGGDAVGATYSRMLATEVGAFIGGSENANYYDNVMADYAKWLETGLDFWHQAAQNLADKWWDSPAIVQGLACWEGEWVGSGTASPWCAKPRIWAMWGMILRATEVPSMWPAIYEWLDSIPPREYPANPITDPREEAVQMGNTCAAAFAMDLLGLDPTRVDTYKAFCHDMATLKFSAAHALADGSFAGPVYGASTGNDSFGSVTVSGTTVTPDTGSFNCDFSTGTGNGAGRAWFYSPANDDGQVTGGDSRSYAISACASDSLTLEQAYEGTGGTKGMQIAAVTGRVTQPFIQGYVSGQLEIAAQTMLHFGDTEGAAAARATIDGINTWILTKGVWPASGGLLYLRNGLTGDGYVGAPHGGGGCEPDPITANNNGYQCTGKDDNSFAPSSATDARFRIGEIMRGIASEYMRTLSPSLKTSADGAFGRLWGGYGIGPGVDGITLNSFFPGSGKAKDYGFCCGLGASQMWLAARLGGVQASNLRDYALPFSLAGVPNAAKWRVKTTWPSGKVTTTTCTSSPCVVTVDARQGDTVLLQTSYLNSSDRVLSTGEQFRLAVQP